MAVRIRSIRRNASRRLRVIVRDQWDSEHDDLSNGGQREVAGPELISATEWSFRPLVEVNWSVSLVQAPGRARLREMLSCGRRRQEGCINGP